MTLTPPDRQSNHGLRKICDCPRRKWAKCPHGWHFNFRWDGTDYRFSLDRHLGRHVDSKTAAESEAEAIRMAIREGRFGQAAPVATMTLEQLTNVYLERYVMVDREATQVEYRYQIGTICRTPLPHPTTGKPLAFGAWRLTDIVTDTIERFREVRRSQGTGLVGVNRSVRRLRAIYNWALRVGYVKSTPFKRHTESVVKLEPEPSRSRRLDADTDEEGRLLRACRPHLRAVVEAALETGMRRGELLSLQWSQVEGLKLSDDRKTITWEARSAIVLPWAKTKTRTARRIPISTRLKAILELRRMDPAGEPLPADAYVFGNEVGQRVADVGRAWERAVLRAHGHEPEYTTTANLKPCCREAFAQIDLHLHDLRREAGSRWLEGGVPLHTVRDWLGHTSIAQTSVYLASALKTAHDAMAQYEERRRAAARLQDLANGSKTGGRKPQRKAGQRSKTGRKTGPSQTPPVM